MPVWAKRTSGIPYELQSMKTWKFIKIVNKILQGDYSMLDTSHCATTIEI